MPTRRLVKKYPRCGYRDEVDMKDIQLYDYQRDMSERIEAAFRSCQSVMVQMPTGTGKTVLLTEVVKNEKGKVKNPCVWIVVHRRELVEQIRETLETMMNSSSTSGTTPWISSFVFSPWQSRSKLRSAHLAYRKRSLLLDDSRIKVMSIQWLSRHYQEMEEIPSLIVIDEAHHAVAKTYKEVMDAYPEAKKLGLTATPCRLTKRGFTDLFDVLLQSWSAKKFIADGWLSLYDYMSIREDSEDWRLVNSLKKRGADGDFSLREMSEKMNVQPSIERLCDTVMRYAANKKGITYAIDIAHAEHIAEAYRQHGINAVAISSKTPLEERKEIIERFKETSIDSKPNYASLSLTKPLDTDVSNKADSTDNTDTPLAQTNNIQVLVNVDLFGEGFDCPDVEFIQLARPTLSLAKYLQMVGRGLRVAKSKECCIILDNVGLYRLFGLPTTEWNWTAMFLGNQSGMGEVNMAKDFALKTIGACYNGQKRERMDMDNDIMVVIARHDAPRVQAQMVELAGMYHTIRNLRKTECGYIGDGVYIRTIEKQGIYKTTNDVRLGWRMVYRTVDGVTLYYALQERSERMEYVGRRNPWSECATGIVKQYFYPCENNDNQLTEIPVEEPAYITGEKRKQQKGSIQQEVNGEYYMVTYVYYGVNKNKGKEFNSRDAYVCEHFMRNEYAISNNNNHIILRGLEKVKLSDDNIAEVVFEGEKKTTWVNLYTMQEFDKCPQVERMGFMELLKVGYNYYFYKNKKLAGIPLRDWGCAVNNRMFMFMEQYVILQEEPDKVYYVEGEYNKGRQWYLKLQDVWGKNPRKMKEIPSAYLPRKY